MGYFNDLDYLISRDSHYSKEDFRNLLYELCTLKDNEKLEALKEMKEEIEEYRADSDLCPICGNELTASVIGIEEIEYQGKTVAMNEYSRYCDVCQWVADK